MKMFMFTALLLAALACAQDKAAPDAVRSYPTADGRHIVRHTKDEGLYFDVPSNEVAYNVQILRRGAEGYATVYHGEPKKTPGKPGDAIKAALAAGAFGGTMPAARTFAIHSDPQDSLSALYSPPDAWGGAGNPMVVRGTDGDPFYHVFFLSVVDDNHDWKGNDFRHVICQARTRDFQEYDLLAEVEGRIEWKPYRDDTPAAWRRPWVLRDETGERICSRFAADPHSTQGLIGSICFHDGRYHFFSTDRDSDGKTYLFVRRASSLVGPSNGRTSWSAATRLSGPLPGGIVIRVAKARDGARWAALYNGYRAGPKGMQADLFLQYTGDLSLTGPQGLAGLRWFDAGGENPTNASMWLGLQSGGGNFSQHCFLTDAYGNLTVTEEDDRSPEVGGMLTWADFTRGVYGGQVYWAKWTIGPANVGTQKSPLKAAATAARGTSHQNINHPTKPHDDQHTKS
jgi:hypothetical protein